MINRMFILLLIYPIPHISSITIDIHIKIKAQMNVMFLFEKVLLGFWCAFNYILEVMCSFKNSIFVVVLRIFSRI